jgi:SsrA-binding protein
MRRLTTHPSASDDYVIPGMTSKDSKDTEESTELIARNKRARHEYEILDTWEAGIVLTGTEVKALRDGRANLTDAFGIINAGEVFLLNLHIGAYGHGSSFNHEPTRTRKLLLHKREIRRLIGSVERQGLTLVPLDLYFRGGRVKTRLALARGKQQHDKREDLKKKDAEREIARVLRKR